jgi:hypothetical protein
VRWGSLGGAGISGAGLLPRRAAKQLWRTASCFGVRGGRGATFKGERGWCWGGVGWLPQGAHVALAGAPGRGADDGPRGRGDSGTTT